MRWCSLQTNEHDLQAIMYPLVCKNHRLNIKNGNKVPVFPGYKCNRWQNMIVQPSQTHNHGKIWQQWERGILVRYFVWNLEGTRSNFKDVLWNSTQNIFIIERCAFYSQVKISVTGWCSSQVESIKIWSHHRHKYDKNTQLILYNPRILLNTVIAGYSSFLYEYWYGVINFKLPPEFCKACLMIPIPIPI